MTKTRKGFRAVAALAAAGALSLGLSGCTKYDTTKPSAARKASAGDARSGARTVARFGTVDCRRVKCVALTFDAGPSENSPRLLDILKEKQVPATFFLLGRGHIAKHPDLVRRMAREGHELASHTWDHRILTDISDADIRDEFKRTDDAVEKLTGKRPTLMRPPQGRTNDHVSELAKKEGLAQILWDVTTKDYTLPPSSTIVDRAVSQTHRDSIILLHDIYKNTVPAVPDIIDQLKAKGYVFVTVPQLLAPGKAEPGKIYKP
ncbi:polysaccharide deacetylase family protein [Streptomyces sp. SID8379]|uniref:polysaccharide deacetylase family protein n=1 Tax=unclassified Streptomyces TaxID=2593676 RepID=UPI0003660761|nr:MULTISPECIES: polysaccharide deacetylase family protein [unclassified Streptomyces]MYW64263.1 polysaccharide deacetylase family protein [Streptomyces sp. SID8379]